MRKTDELLFLKIFAKFFSSAGSQTFIIFNFPTLGFIIFLPGFIFTFIIEDQFLSTLARFQNWSIHESDKVGNFRQARPFRLEQVDTESLDVAAIQILVSHKENTTISQALCDIGCTVIFLSSFKTKNFLDFGNLFILGNLFYLLTAHIENLTLHRINANSVSIFGGKPRNNSSLG